MTWMRRTALALIGVGMLLAPATPALAQVTPVPAAECSATYHQSDPRLGPQVLPRRGVLGAELIGYRRTGGLDTQTFLDTYWDQGAGWWRYPPANGYLLRPDGTPIIVTSRLFPGQVIDRFGSEYGQFLAPFGLPYASRSIPPQSLVSTPAGYCNYRAYRVVKPFTVDSGPIAPWFAQPGLGWQYHLNAERIEGAPTPLTVLWLLDNGYLQRIIGPPQTRSAALERAPAF